MTPRCVDHSLSLSQQDVEKEPLFTGVIPESGCQTTDQFNGRTHVVVGSVDTRNPPYWLALKARRCLEKDAAHIQQAVSASIL